MKRILVLCALVSSHLFVTAQKVDKKLQQQLEVLVKDFKGDIGVYVKDLHSNKVVNINADTVFPTASMVKVPILVGVMDKINRGELQYHQPLTYRDSLLYEGEDILGSFKQDEKIQLSKVMMLMLTTSDNTASLWLQSLAGKGTRINEILDSMGFVNTRVNSRTPGREANRSQYGWGQSSPKEMASLFEKIYKGEVISNAASDKMLRLLNRNYYDEVAISQLPPNALVYSKNGAVNQTRNETLLVKGNKAEYVFCIMSKNNQDSSWNNENEAWVLTRKISQLLWNYYEPKSKWTPAVDASKFD
ncbi:serine hydrolase [Flavisolibacter tropicus]|uniref:beta-lactamase n=1 Tax=Flavisolibacter tropicus TaxID=1492898 RepID=A0A172TXN2_9BACT|nr:serine hydrolase [Flavisolibacter tropicus]ANE51766.1 beta-lactamase [Flavisolibacter tropicus]